MRGDRQFDVSVSADKFLYTPPRIKGGGGDDIVFIGLLVFTYFYTLPSYEGRLTAVHNFCAKISLYTPLA